MAQPPPRKGAYNKFVQNLHKDQFSKLQAKNQQELDLLDDIRNFMKQRAAIEKHYAEGLVKLSSVYGTKKIANLDDVRNDGDPQVVVDPLQTQTRRLKTRRRIIMRRRIIVI